ncbi:MAG: cytochrome c oxidase subunit 3 [Chlamydiales bacterium]|nr:cytochrome c oxidase subunit 3 [Chlamydiales bacterium]
MTHEHHDPYEKTIFGFWVYLLTDFIMFATLFAVYAVLRDSTFGGPGAKDLFNLPLVLVQTLLLLGCSLTSGVASVYAHRGNKNGTLLYFAITFALGFIFLWMGLADFHRLIAMDASWKVSGFLSGYFSLVGTHTVHILIGLAWIVVLLLPVIKQGLNDVHIKRITCLRMFWQFMNIIWIFIYTIVYLVGVN